MARRATSPSRKQTKAQPTASATMSEPVAAETPRRGRKAKSTMSEPVEPSLTDNFFPGGEEPVETGAEIGSNAPIKARRGRQSKAQPDEQAPASMAANTGVQTERAPPEPISTSDSEPLDVQRDSSTSPSASPRKTRRRRNTQGEGQPAPSTDTPAAVSQPKQQAAARWDADTGTATFDWPSIEQVAATDGPNQAMAKLLLAARAEGANSRWPF